MKDMTATAAEAAKVQERIKELTDYLDLLKADLRDNLAPGKKLTVYTPNSEHTVSVAVRKDSVRLDTTALKKKRLKYMSSSKRFRYPAERSLISASTSIVAHCNPWGTDPMGII